MEIVKHKCFISFKKENESYKVALQEMKDKGLIDFIDKSLNEPIDSKDPDYIMRKIRKDYLSDSTVTIFLIGKNSNESLGWEEQQYIKRELQASLYNAEGNTRSGILGIVLPEMYDSIFKGIQPCSTCKYSHNTLCLDGSTVVKEFSVNYFITPHTGCAWSEDERYCVLVKWDDFIGNPETYIEMAFNKRSADVAKKVTVYPK